jgi:hypothetical protein
MASDFIISFILSMIFHQCIDLKIRVNNVILQNLLNNVVKGDQSFLSVDHIKCLTSEAYSDNEPKS